MVQEKHRFMTAEIQEFLDQARLPLRLACVTRSGWPLLLSLWYTLENGNLYCATQKSAAVVIHLRENPRCAFEVSNESPPYLGVRGRARATVIEDRGPEILEKLIARYLKGSDTPLGEKLLARRESELAIALAPERFFAWDYRRRMKDSV